MKSKLLVAAGIVILFIFPPFNAAGTNGSKGERPEDNREMLKQTNGWLKNQPVLFLENRGQLKNSAGLPADNVLFWAEAAGTNVYITEEGITYVQLKYEKGGGDGPKRPDGRPKKKPVMCERVDMILGGASIRKENVIRSQETPYHYNYLYGPGENSIYNVKKYGHITIRNVYPGIDWVLYNTSGEGFKYDFVVHPGVNPEQIELIYRSDKMITKEKDGSLRLETSLGRITEKPPVSFTEDKRSVKSSFTVKETIEKDRYNETHIGFDVGKYATDKQLVIDPVLLWATFFGGTSFEGTYCTDPDQDGNVYLCGYLGSNDFPLMDAGTFIDTTVGTSFIIKFTNNGTLLWSTYLKGQCSFLDTDIHNNLFVCGSASDTIIPLKNAGTYFQGGSAGAQDAFIVKFNSAGSITWCTYFGGSGAEYSPGITTDGSGNIYLTGSTTSSNLPVQNGGGYYEGTITQPGSSGFVAKFDNNGTLIWSTYMKNIGQPICTADQTGNVYLVGYTSSTNIPLQMPGGTGFYQGTGNGTNDSYIIKMDGNGNLLWGTFYGGSGMDMATGVQTDKSGNVFVCGSTTSTDLTLYNAGTYYQAAITSSLQEIFILKFDNTATMKWGTYIGGSRNDYHSEDDNLAIDTCGNVFLGFTTRSRNVPFQQACDPGMFDNSIDTSLSQIHNNVYLARFTNNGDLMWSSLFGGDGNSFRTTLGADRFGNVFFSGEWNGVQNAASYPLMWPGGSTYTQSFAGYEDLYVAKFTNKPPVQTFSYAPSCISTPVLPPVLPTGFTTGGTFSASGGISIDPSTGDIYPNTSAPGTYTVSYMHSLCYCPGAIATVGMATVNLLAAPLLTISGPDTLCVGEKVTYTLTGATSFTWHNATTQPTLSVAPTSTNPIILTVTSTENPLCVSTKNRVITVERCLGVAEFAGGNRITVYPNPNSGQFTAVAEKAGNYRLVNQLGQLVQQVTFSDKNGNKAEIQGLSPGVYFLEGNATKGGRGLKIVVTE